MYLGKNIRYLRRKAGLTQEELATRLSLKNSAIGKWERGHNLPTVDTLVVLSGLFLVSTDQLTKEDLEAQAQNQGEDLMGKATSGMSPEMAVQMAEVMRRLEAVEQDRGGRQQMPEEIAELIRIREELRRNYPDVARDINAD